MAEGSWRESRRREGSLERERLVNCEEGREGSQGSGVRELVKDHLRPRHWQSGVEVVHEDRRRLGAWPWSAGLILVKRMAMSEEGEEEEEEEEGEDWVRVVRKVVERMREVRRRERRFGSAMAWMRERER